MKAPHQSRVPSRDGLVIVMHQQPVVLICWALSVSKVCLKPRHHLLKRLLIYSLRCPSRVEVSLVDALCEQSSVLPLRNTFRDIPNQLTTLVSRQVDVWLCVRECLLLLPVCPPLLGFL